MVGGGSFELSLPQALWPSGQQGRPSPSEAPSGHTQHLHRALRQPLPQDPKGLPKLMALASGVQVPALGIVLQSHAFPGWRGVVASGGGLLAFLPLSLRSVGCSLHPRQHGCPLTFDGLGCLFNSHWLVHLLGAGSVTRPGIKK